MDIPTDVSTPTVVSENATDLVVRESGIYTRVGTYSLMQREGTATSRTCNPVVGGSLLTGRASFRTVPTPLRSPREPDTAV